MRSGDFLHDLSAAIDELRRQGVTTRILYLDAGDDVLVRRYEESRRRHPLSDSRSRQSTASRANGRCSSRSWAKPTCASTRRPSTCTSCATGCASSSRDTGSDATLQINVVYVRLQARSPARRRPRVRLPLPAEPALGRRAPPAHRSRRAGSRLRARATRHQRVPRRARPPLRAACCPATSAKARRYLSIAFGCTGGRHRSVVIAEQTRPNASTVKVTAPRYTTGTSTVPSDAEWFEPESSRSVGDTGSRSHSAPCAAYADEITAVVSVADDGGSSGRLRRDLGVAAPGDLRKCLVALADGRRSVAGRVRAPLRERRARGSPLGNLCIVGLAESLGDLTASARRSGRSSSARRAG